MDLSDTQQAETELIRETHQESVADLRDELQAVREEIADLLFGPADVDASDFTAFQDDLSQIHTALFDARIAMQLAIRDVLTADQLAEALALIQERRE